MNLTDRVSHIRPPNWHWQTRTAALAVTLASLALWGALIWLGYKLWMMAQ